MNAAHLDHVNLRIPADRVDDAVAFYRDTLGFALEDLDAYRDGDRPIFSVRLSETSIIHLSPSEEFRPSTATNFDHVAIVVDDPIDEVRQELTERLQARLGDANLPAVEAQFRLDGATGSVHDILERFLGVRRAEFDHQRNLALAGVVPHPSNRVGEIHRPEVGEAEAKAFSSTRGVPPQNVETV